MTKSSDAARPALAVFTHGELIGDAMVKLPFLKALRAAFPDWRIVWVCTESSQLQAAAASLIPGVIDEFVSGTGWGERWTDVLKPPPTDERFQLVIDTQAIWWRTLIARRLRGEVFVSGCAGFAFSDKKPSLERRKLRHGLARLLSLIEAATGAPVTQPRLRDCVSVPADLQEEAARILPAGPVYVALAPGAGKRSKCWPLANHIELARRQAAAGRVPVFLLGPNELEWSAQLREAVPQALFPLQADGPAEPRYTPLRTIAVARRCAVAVGADCGLTHILGVADAPLVSLFGPTSGVKVHPKVTAGVWLQAQDFGPDGAMAHIPVEAVAAAVEKLLGGEG
jgi:ADP-heptose:LPS heptosyltransferase